jgi:hypothetical protein
MGELTGEGGGRGGGVGGAAVRPARVLLLHAVRERKTGRRKEKRREEREKKRRREGKKRKGKKWEHFLNMEISGKVKDSL